MKTMEDLKNRLNKHGTETDKYIYNVLVEQQKKIDKCMRLINSMAKASKKFGKEIRKEIEGK